MVLKVDMLVSCNAPRNDRVGNKRCSPHKTTTIKQKARNLFVFTTRYYCLAVLQPQNDPAHVAETEQACLSTQNLQHTSTLSAIQIYTNA